MEAHQLCFTRFDDINAAATAGCPLRGANTGGDVPAVGLLEPYDGCVALIQQDVQRVTQSHHMGSGRSNTRPRVCVGKRVGAPAARRSERAPSLDVRMHGTREVLLEQGGELRIVRRQLRRDRLHKDGQLRCPLLGQISMSEVCVLADTTSGTCVNGCEKPAPQPWGRTSLYNR